MYKIKLTLWLTVVSLVICYSVMPPGQEKEELCSGCSVLGLEHLGQTKTKTLAETGQLACWELCDQRTT